MLLLATAFATGIAVSGFLPAGLGWAMAACTVFAIAALVIPRSSWIATMFVGLAFVAGGVAVHKADRAAITPDRVREIYDSGRIASGDPVEISGTVTRSVESGIDGFFIRVEVDSVLHRRNLQRASGEVRLYASASTAEMQADYARLDLRPGTKLRIACELKRDDEFRNPGGLSRKEVLEWQDLDASGSIKSPLLVEVLEPGGSDLTAFVFGIREQLIAKFRELFSPQVAGVMIASLLGNKQFLDAQTAQIFREGGTFHILVISGLHITFIGALAALFVGLFTRRRGVQFIIVCTFLWLYTIAVGAEVPVVRASLMFTVLWLSMVIHRTGSLANALGTCGLILLVWRPNDLFSPSFQLTFVSVAAIVLAGFPMIKTFRAIGEWVPSTGSPFPADVPKWLKSFCETLYWNERQWEIDSARNVWSARLFKTPFAKPERTLQRLAAYLFEGILISLIVQIAMLPLQVHYFHRVTPVSVPLNLWTGVFIALESFSSLIAVLFSYVSESLALSLIRLTEFFHWLLVFVPGQLSDSRWLSFRVPVYSGLEPWLYMAYLVCVLALGLSVFVWDPFKLRARLVEKGLRRKLPVFAAAVVLVLGGIIVFYPFSEPRPDGRLHVEFLDVGQGDSIFITFPNGETMLVDGGGRTSFRGEDDDEIFEPDVPSIGETVVSEFLWEKGYSHIDHIVATHADADHIQGLSDVARNFTIGEAWLGRINPDDRDQKQLLSILDKTRVPVRMVTRGSDAEIGGVRVEVLSPPEFGADVWPENDASVVIRLTYGDRSFLLTGDAEKLAESEMLRSGQPLNASVLKVPHHGSRTSSTEPFIDNVKAQFAVMPVGRRSMFGHPHREVVERLSASGTVVLTTGNNGTISFSSNGKDLSIKSFVRNSEE